MAALVDETYQKGWPVHMHANGDAAIDPTKINTIQVMETIKDGKTVYVRE